jgi:TonB family protein
MEVVSMRVLSLFVLTLFTLAPCLADGGDKSAKQGAAPPASSPTLNAPKPVEFGPYIVEVDRSINHGWTPPAGNESKRVVVQFKIHRGGELSNLRFDHSSGLAIADQAALKAIENAAPFKPLPKGAPDTIDIQFVFDKNVFSGGGHAMIR